jgi:hypothetical protein
MKFYVQKNDDIVVAYGCSSELPEDVTEITEEEYKSGISALAEADAKAKEKEELEAREKESAERQAKIDDYVNKVKAGTVKIEDVLEDFRTSVENIINPPKTDNERLAEVEKQTANIQSAMDDLMMMVAGTATESEA